LARSQKPRAAAIQAHRSIYLAGLAILAGIWLGYQKMNRENRASIWTALGWSFIVLSFIAFHFFWRSHR